MSVVGTAQKRPMTGQCTADDAGKYTVRDVYRVITDSLTDEFVVVTAASGLPLLFDEYPSVPSLRVRRYEAQRLSPASLVWEVVVVYETPEPKSGSTGGGGGSGPAGTGEEKPGQFTDPTLELPTVKFHSTSREVIISQVIDVTTGALKPPSTSNGEVIDPPPKMLKRYITLEISRNEPITAPHPALAITYTNAVNSDTFWGLVAGVWMCKDITAERQVRQLTGGQVALYLKVTYQFEGTDTWDLVLLDYGTYYLFQDVSSPTVLPAQIRQFRTLEGHPTAFPLNGQGGALPRNLPFSVNTGTDLVTVVVGSSGATFANNDILQISCIGGIPPAPLIAGQAYYVKGVSGATFQLSLTPAGAAIDFTTAGTGQSYVSMAAVYNTIRPYPRLPFAALGLPQTWLDVQ